MMQSLHAFSGQRPASTATRYEDVNLGTGEISTSRLCAIWCVVIALYSDDYDICVGVMVAESFVRSMLCRIESNDTLDDVEARLEESPGGDTESTVGGAPSRTAVWFERQTMADASMFPLSMDLALVVKARADGTGNRYMLLFRESFMSGSEARNVCETLSHIRNMHPSTTLGNMSPSSRDISQMVSWNPKQFLMEEKPIQAMFAEQVQQRPHHVALDAWDGRMTYAELDGASDTLGIYLIRKGLVPGSFVLLCFEKSVWTAVAILAVLKARGACVMVDPEHPAQRVAHMAQATAAKYMLASQTTVNSGKFSELEFSLVQVPLDQVQENENDTVLHVNNMDWPHILPSSSPAFAVFTSGSTGTPKAIVHSHTSICTSAVAIGDAYGINQQTRVLQFAGPAFDISLEDYLVSLLRGATVCIMSEWDRWNNIEGFATKVRANWTNLTPTVARMLRPSKVPSLRTLVLIGESMGEADVEPWLEAGVEVYNAYGPTENGFASTTLPKPGVSNGRGHVSGYGINTSIWIVSQRPNTCSLCPVGAIGEICLEGSVVAKGYLNDPVLSNEKFVVDPEWARCTGTGRGRRFYRTGDLGRLRADGALEVMGRIDTQVKLGGQRLELSEVEHYIRQTGAVPDAAVFVPKTGPFRERLTAVVKGQTMLREGEQPVLMRCPETMAVEASRALSVHLPRFMVPVVWMKIEHFPLTGTGKLARSLILPALEAFQEAQYPQELNQCLDETMKESASSGLCGEALLQSLCSEVLGIPRSSINPEKSFVSLGGDSIMAMRVVNRCRAASRIVTAKELLADTPLCEITTQTLRASNSDSEPEPSSMPVRENLAVDDIEWVALVDRVQALDAVKSLEKDVEDILPLSPMQESMAISSAKLSEVYMVEFVWEVKGSQGLRLDVRTLEEAWQQVVDRHQALRTVFVESSDTSSMFYQIILRKSRARCLRIHALDLEEALRALREAPRLPKDAHGAGYGMPAHSMVFCSTEIGSVFVRLEISHLISDDMSMVPLLRDWSRAYESKLDIRDGPKYSDFVRWRRQEQLHDSSLEYWSSFLQGAEPCPFPALLDEHGSTGVGDSRTNEQRTVQLSLGVEFADLRSILARRNLTIPTYFKMVWAMVLRAYTGRSEVVFGNLVSGRDAPIPGVEEAVGLLIGMIVCRVETSPDSSLYETMKKIQEDALDGAQHQSCSLAEIQHAIGLPARSLFNSGLAFHSSDLTDKDREGWVLKFAEVSQQYDPTEYELALIIDLGRNEIQAHIAYHTSRLCDDAVANVAGIVEHLSHELLLDLDRKTSEVAMLSLRDRQQIWRWNKACIRPIDKLIHAYVEQSMHSHSEKQAVYSWDGQMTYEELDNLSRRLAKHLFDVRGVGPEVVVPLCFDKSIWAVVAMLGVLRAGGCFVILDMTSPDTRLVKILEQVDPRLILCSPRVHTHLRRLLPLLQPTSDRHRPPHVLPIIGAWVGRLPRVYDEELPICASVTPDHAMYIVFTSGTTGIPKGSLVTHRAYCTGFREHCVATEVWPTSRALQFSSYAFDSSIGEILTTLGAGGCVCVPSEDMRNLEIVGFIQEARVNWAAWTPSFAALVNPASVPTLKGLLLAGEPLPAWLVERWVGTGVKVINVYGPSEASVASTHFKIKKGNIFPSNSIGRGHRCVTWIVDENDHERLLPIGAVGELLIEGPILARGYLNLPEKTREVFIGAPSWLREGTPVARPQARLYKTGGTTIRPSPPGRCFSFLHYCLAEKVTGVSFSLYRRRVYIKVADFENFEDLVQYSSDGTLNYIGRKDTQLKINGQRVELGDVEHHLRAILALQLSPQSKNDKSGSGGPEIPQIAVELLRFEAESASNSYSKNLLTAFLVVGERTYDRFADPVAPTSSDQSSIIFHDMDSQTRARFNSLIETIAKSSLHQRLPSYMIPQVFIPLKRMPISLAGKTDRRALHQATSKLSREELVLFASGRGDGDDTSFKVPEAQTYEEEVLYSLVKQILDLVCLFGSLVVFNSLEVKLIQFVPTRKDSVSMQDDFFRLGGNSLLAIRLSAQARRKKLNLSVQDIFRAPRIVDMAHRASSQSSRTPGSQYDDQGPVEPFSLLRLHNDLVEVEDVFKDIIDKCNVAQDDIEDVYPCTPLQEALMALSARTSTSRAYTTHQLFHIPSEMDVEYLKEAWTITSRTHSILRSRIVTADRGALIVAVKTPLSIKEIDTDETQRWQQASFEYGSPLIRIGIVRHGQRQHLAIIAHHAIFDGWSMKLIWEDVVQAFHGLQGGIHTQTAILGPPQPSEPPPFQAFVRHIMQSPRAPSEEFWKATLANADHDACFPRIPSGHQPLASSKIQDVFVLPTIPDHSSSSFTVPTMIQAGFALLLAQYGGATAATFAVALSGRDTPVHGIEDVVGPTMATIPRHLRICGDETIQEFLEYAHTSLLTSTPHQHIGLDHIRRLGPGPRAACSFTSVLVIQPGSKLDIETSTSKLNIKPQPASDEAFHPFPLNVECWLTADGRVHVEMCFDPACLTESQAGGMMRQLDHLLRGIGQSAAMNTVSSIMTPAPTEMAKLLEWSGSVPAATDSCMHDIIARHAAATPQREAVATSEGSLSYGELDRRANQLAHHLVSTPCYNAAVGPDQFVGICFEKSLHAVVSIVAVLKAGAAFMPLNPSHPPARLDHAISKAGSGLVLASRTTQPSLSSLTSSALLVVDEDLFVTLDSEPQKGGTKTEERPANHRRALLPSSKPSNAAYLICTSGSTGEPKLVVVEHRALCSGITAQAAAIRCDQDTRMLQCAAFSFDASIMELFNPLILGGCACLPSDAERTDPDELAAFIRRQGVNAVTFTPSLLRLLDPTLVPGLRTVVTGGEPLMTTDIEAWSHGPGDVPRSMYNVYGVTEACVVSASMPVTQGTNPKALGYPIGARCWVVGVARDTLAPIGAMGELYLEGPSLARGYLGDPGRNEASFLIDPSWLPPTETGTHRLVYRTGDMVYYDGQGVLMFVGRRDGQVKVRGQRVEPDEVSERIRKCMSREPLFSNAAVELYTPQSREQEPCLVALIALKLGDSQSEVEEWHQGGLLIGGEPWVPMQSSAIPAIVRLRVEIDAELRKTLPAVEVPSAYVAVKRLPVTASGKLDKRLVQEAMENMRKRDLVFRGRSLQSMAAAASTCNQNLDPHSDVGRLQECWAKVLGIEERSSIGIDDNFFDLGGSSISSIRLIGMVRKLRLGRLKYEDVVMRPRLGDMASCLLSPDASGTSTTQQDQQPEQNKHNIDKQFDLFDKQQLDVLLSEALPSYDIDPSQVEEAYPCTPMQEAFMAMTALDDGAYISFQVLKVPPQDILRVQQAWQAVYQKFELLRTRIIPWSGSGNDFNGADSRARALQIVMRDTKPVYCQVKSTNAFVKATYADHGYGRPLVRFGQVEAPTAEGHIQMIFAAHHAIYDGFSMSLVWKSLRDHLEGREIEHIPRFKDFIRHVICRRHDHRWEDEMETFWKAQLSGADCTDFPRGLPSSIGSSSSPPHRPNASMIIKTKTQLSDGHSQPAFRPSVLALATWALVLSHYTNNPDVSFGVALSGRETDVAAEAGVGLVAGPTLAVVPFRLCIDYDPAESTIQRFLTKVQRLGLDMTRFAHLGLDRISKLGRDARRACNFQSHVIVQPAQAQQHLDSGSGILASLEDLHTPAMYPHALMVECVPSLDAKDMSIHLGYDPQLVGRELAHGILQTFSDVLSRLAAEASLPGGATNMPLCKLQGLSDHDRTKLLVEDRERVPSSLECRIQDAVLEQTRIRPESVAIDAWDGTVTYAQLEQSANLLSRKLSQLGVRVGRAVPLLMERSKWAIIAMLGVWMAGGYVVPLGVSHPAARLQGMVDSVDGVVVLVSSSAKSPELTKTLQRTTLAVDESLFATLVSPQTPPLTPPSSPSVVSEEDGLAFGSDACPRDLAYALFTSGSTGTPKAVMVEHRSLSSSLAALRTTLHLGPETRMLQFASYIFDIMLCEIWGTLTAGGCVCVPPGHGLERMDNLAETIHKLAVNHICCTPSLSRLLSPDSIPLVRQLSLGGEAMLQSDKERWCARGIKLFNVYGPAEACIASTAQETTLDTRFGTIGVPLASCRVWVVNPLKAQHGEFELSPIGAIGELFIEGPNVARGYLGDPHRTASAFMARPPWLSRQEAHSLELYPCFRSGDLVCRNSDGSLSFVGRMDAHSQVKVRGQRVELGEVADAIRRHLPECVSRPMTVAVDVCKPAGGKGPAMLVAVLGINDGPRPASESASDSGSPRTDLDYPEVMQLTQNLTRRLRPRLQSVLPSYMVPDAYIPLRSLPMNISGKLDSRALRRRIEGLDHATFAYFTFLSQLPGTPDSEPMIEDNSHTVTGLGLGVSQSENLPLSAEEQLLARIWPRVLGLPSSERHAALERTANFFALGGDSILAARLVAETRRHGFQLTSRDIFAKPTLSSMASAMKNTICDVAATIPITAAYRVQNKALSSATRLTGKLPSCAVEVLPATSMQNYFMGTTIKYPGVNLSHIIFGLDSGIDLVWLKAAVTRCAEWFPILRTRMLSRPDEKDELVQVVVQDPPPWSFTTGSLEEAIMEESQQGPGLGSHLTRICVVGPRRGQINAGRNGATHVIWTTHHATFDGVSIQLLFSHLEKAYIDASYKPPPDQLSFSDFVAYVVCCVQNSAKIRNFWASFLSDGPCTKPLFNYGSIPDPCRTQAMSCRFSLPRHKGRSKGDDWEAQDDDNVVTLATATTATLVTAAWAKVLGRLVNSPRDVTMGYMMSGRSNSHLPGIEGTIGPTINRVPLRIRVPEVAAASHTQDDGAVGDNVIDNGPSFAAVLEATHHALLLVSEGDNQMLGMREISATSDDARAICAHLPLDLVVHPRPDHTYFQDPHASDPNGIKDENDGGMLSSLPGRSIGLRPLEVRIAATQPGGFMAEVMLLDGEDIMVHVRWDERAAERGQIERVLDEFSGVLQEAV